MSKKFAYVIATLVVMLLVISACSPAAATAPTVQVKDTQPSAATVQPTAAPTSASGGLLLATKSGTSGPVTLKISGLVGSELSLSEDKVKAMKTTDVISKNNKGEASTYTGVLLSDLLNQASPKANAVYVAFVAEDGFTAKAPLADVMKCANCILSFRSNGGFSSVLPTFASNLQVKGVVEIQVTQ